MDIIYLIIYIPIIFLAGVLIFAQKPQSLILVLGVIFFLFAILWYLMLAKTIALIFLLLYCLLSIFALHKLIQNSTFYKTQDHVKGCKHWIGLFILSVVLIFVECLLINKSLLANEFFQKISISKISDQNAIEGFIKDLSNFANAFINNYLIIGIVSVVILIFNALAVIAFINFIKSKKL